MSKRWCAALLAVAAAVQLAEEAAADGWQAGAAAAKITPNQPMWMAGYGSRTHDATGLISDLWAKARCSTTGTAPRVAFITLDLVGIGRDLVDPIRAHCKRGISWRRRTWRSAVRTRTAGRPWDATCGRCSMTLSASAKRK